MPYPKAGRVSEKVSAMSRERREEVRPFKDKEKSARRGPFLEKLTLEKSIPPLTIASLL
jgi:hypothetical protein